MGQTDSCQRGGGGWIKKMKGLAKEHVCITHRLRQRCGLARGKGGGGWVEADRWGENRDIC